ncbi:bifunctional diaminohydroxyphosphoribosylaminopyrimidine deaminase/5-amino-6-(5-phosphoribosylamino)uracil reductase RibD [Legionella genomosp. 1]|uniref:bifunctional diaminohydroxyphosphoribosylaminopyrimidine deaminase/5-amino-6-(5-phosphoribosylamino)uracil reductase RibD n=1 Tax=Legionella genomosp. 1 TaxID=1093625 RepID=UPI0010552FC2|nr:bifunctional diaminohydroxyphosphoribosylaminopyrimidine deaminase/5-amino-6-(5-phosphoribosylamino)uracil reductase RibD [Legionella genomosp. 1]
MHNQFMLAALEQAWIGRGNCAPNPSVGAIVVLDGKILASAYHRGVGCFHAERSVLEQVAEQARGASLYVSLEPCNHWGRTPPCVDIIISAGISKVIYGYKDPNPLVAANNSTQILQEKGIEVIYWPMPEIGQFYQSYAFWTRTGRPWVTAKIAHTLDGKIAGEEGARVQLSNEECSRFTHFNRLHTDVILTSAMTIIKDDPLFNARMPDFEKKKKIAILDSRLSIPDDAKIFSSAEHCYIFHDEGHSPLHMNPNCSYYPAPMIKGHIDLNYVLEQLGLWGFHDVWLEAGGKLFSTFHEQKLPQRSYLYIVPGFLGQQATSAYHGDNFFQSRKYSIDWQIAGDNVIACIDWQEE